MKLSESAGQSYARSVLWVIGPVALRQLGLRARPGCSGSWRRGQAVWTPPMARAAARRCPAVTTRACGVWGAGRPPPVTVSQSGRPDRQSSVRPGSQTVHGPSGLVDIGGVMARLSITCDIKGMFFKEQLSREYRPIWWQKQIRMRRREHPSVSLNNAL